MSKTLVIVESPAKAKTISKYLGKEYQVEASIGHIRDLPARSEEIPESVKKEKWARIGVNVDDDFKPLYVIPSDKKKQVKKLKEALKNATTVLLATDEDREGESISWHLCEVLKPKTKVQRLVFHEITEEALKNALQKTREIDMNLVRAQESRRILDRLFGYELSPVLWRTVAPRLSAGRVQSVAIKLVVEREKQRSKFKEAVFFDLSGLFENLKKEKFEAVLKSINGKELAQGKDFDPESGKLRDTKKILLDEKSANELLNSIKNQKFFVSDIQKKPYRRTPEAPFTTSTLQQEAARKLRFTAKNTMRVAQKLYENGYITYMRTDSTTLSQGAIDESRKTIEKLYGKNYLPSKQIVYKSKIKNAQEAHEAIRPSGKSFKLPEHLRNSLSPDEYALYDLIWKRTIASQMNEAQMESTVAIISDGKHDFEARGKIIVFPGFLKAYVQGSDDPEEMLEDQEKLLPELNKKEKISVKNLESRSHQTKPVPRYTEASLIKELESKGIGRPSTYASIMDTIQKREYVLKKQNALIPTFTAFAVCELLDKHFSHLVDYQFTAKMEEALDEIALGEKKHLPYLKEFYFGSKELKGLKELIAQKIDARSVCTLAINKKISVRVGKYGPYLESGEKRAPLSDEIAPSELTPDLANKIIALETKDNILGIEPKTKLKIHKKVGRYGPYLQLGDKGDDGFKLKSIPKHLNSEQLSLDEALKILELPKEISEGIFVDIGPFGPYLKSPDGNFSISEEFDPFKVTKKDIIKIKKTAAASKNRRGGTTIREIGGGLFIKKGKYGMYVTNGKKNASVPKDIDPQKIEQNEAKKLLKMK